MTKHVLFIQGAGEGAHDEDALLVASLERALGSEYDVRFPRMRNEGSPEYSDWKPQLATELANRDDRLILVGHSVGGSVLLKYLSEEQVDRSIAGVFLIAAPFWNGDGIWTWEDVRLPNDIAVRLAGIPRIFLYHSRDDEIVPFTHLARYTALLPRATVREFEGRGHQFRNDLSEVAEDITRDESSRKR
jgi:hypothetical protein